MGYFESFFDINGTGEQKVCCPFPHKSNIGTEYLEENPSASVNLDKKVFHCSCCGAGYKEAQFIQKILGCTSPQAQKLKVALEASKPISEWENMNIYETGLEVAERQGISKQAVVELKIKSNEHNPDMIMFPVTYFDRLVDVREYTPNGKPKVKSKKGAPAGLIVHENAMHQNKIIFICEGEHDLGVLTSLGLNAITLTGGAAAVPIDIEAFRNKKVAIVYDNDDAGEIGAIRLANLLLPICKSVKNITTFHTNLDRKGDIADWVKAGGTREQLINMYKSTEDWEYVELVQAQKSIDKCSIADATKVENIGKTVYSTVQVNGTNDDMFVCPTYINCVKVAEGAGDMSEGMQADWELNDNNLRDIISICAVSADDKSLKDRYKELCGVMHTEKNIAVKTDCYRNIYISNVMDVNVDNPQEITVYSIGKKLESGHKYTIKHKVVTSPKTAGLLLSVCIDASEAVSDVDSFEINNTSKEYLMQFQQLGETLQDRLNISIQKVKGLLGYNGNEQLIQTIDLAYHTPLYFNFGRFSNVRAYIDTLIIGESRVGKSSTAQCLMDCYGLGQFVSLAGNSATIPALIGGSNKTSSGQMQTKAGIIPMNHKGLIVFEEFGKCSNNITAELTDVRSSNEVRINRVAGSLTLPAFVRMVTLSNVKPTSTGDIRPINSYPNGIAIATELVPTAEDIARYDAILISAYKGDNQIDPLWIPEEPMSKEAYKTRIRWVWSRTADQIIFDDGVPEYVVETCNMLNKEYECHIKIYGTEAWKKLCRVAIAIAGYTVSSDESFENIIVTKEAVTLATNYLMKLYDNDTFRLREYVNNEKKYSEIDKAGIQLLGELYFKCDTLLKSMDEEAQPTKTSLTAAYGGTNDDFNAIMRQLTRANMIRINGTNINPTTRFRKGMAMLKREDWIVERCYERLE